MKEDETGTDANSNEHAMLDQPFVSAQITRYYSLEIPPSGRPDDEESATVVTDPGEVKQLVSFFHGVGQERVSPNSAGWEKFADIWFVRTDGSKLRISISPGLDTWADGHGEWPIRDAERFRLYFLKLLRQMEK